MNRSTTERSAAYTLTWSLRTPDDRPVAEAGALTLAWALEAHEELYVTDRLWDYGAPGQRVPDPYGVYRFVRDGSLRLVFSNPPKPPHVMIRVVYQPFSSRVRAGETLRREVEIALPVAEDSALARNVEAPTALEAVRRVFLVLGYRRRATLDADPIPPPHESAEGTGYIVHAPEHILSGMDVDPIPVRRREGYIARFTLPGEAPLVPARPPR